MEEREIGITDVKVTNLQRLCDSIISIPTKTSEECFPHLAESKSNVFPVWGVQGVT